MKIGILHSRIRQEEKLLLAEMDRQGVPYEMVNVERLAIPLDGPGLSTPWADFDAVLERCISHSRASAILRVLHLAGVPCINPWNVAEVCGDKLATNLALLAAGLPAPRARIAFTPESALEAIEELGYPAVLKPAVGSWGRLLARVTNRDAAEAVLEHKATLGTYHHSIFYVQEHVEKDGRDIRAFVVGDETVCAIERTSDHWITNTARGAKASNHAVTPELNDICVRAAHAVGGGVVAVDLFIDKEGAYLVNEVNYTMEFRNSIEPTGVNIPERVVQYMVAVAERRVLLPRPMHGIPTRASAEVER